MTNGKIYDVMILVNLLNEHKNYYKPARLWDQIEAVACEQCFTEDERVPYQTLQEIICLYAFEFSRSQNEFTDFYNRFFKHMEANSDILLSTLSLTGISNAAIAYVSFGMSTEDQAEFWTKVRKGATN